MTTTSTELITLEQVEDVLLHGGTVETVPPEQVQEDIVRRILAADSATEAFAMFSTVNARDLDGAVVTVKDVAWMRSAFSEGPGVYAMLQCRPDKAKEDVVVSMGGRSVMAGFLWAQRNDQLPLKGTFRLERSKSDPEKTYWTFRLV